MNTPTEPDSEYQRRKRHFDRLLTIYGRKPVLEALGDASLSITAIHLADSNKPARILEEIVALASQRDIALHYHDKRALSRISRNARQDQGVAADLDLPGYQPLETWLQGWRPEPGARLLALDGVTNPQNLGMIIRSVAGSGAAGLLLPRRGNAQLSPLAIKASAGTAFRCPIIHCDKLDDALHQLQDRGARVAVLSANAGTDLFEDRKHAPAATIYVLGSESEGVSDTIENIADTRLGIALENGVESLNVAVAAALVAFAR